MIAKSSAKRFDIFKAQTQRRLLRVTLPVDDIMCYSIPTDRPEFIFFARSSLNIYIFCVKLRKYKQLATLASAVEERVLPNHYISTITYHPDLDHSIFVGISLEEVHPNPLLSNTIIRQYSFDPKALTGTLKRQMKSGLE